MGIRDIGEEQHRDDGQHRYRHRVEKNMPGAGIELLRQGVNHQGQADTEERCRQDVSHVPPFRRAVRARWRPSR